MLGCTPVIVVELMGFVARLPPAADEDVLCCAYVWRGYPTCPVEEPRNICPVPDRWPTHDALALWVGENETLPLRTADQALCTVLDAAFYLGTGALRALMNPTTPNNVAFAEALFEIGWMLTRLVGFVFVDVRRALGPLNVCAHFVLALCLALRKSRVKRRHARRATAALQAEARGLVARVHSAVLSARRSQQGAYAALVAARRKLTEADLLSGDWHVPQARHVRTAEMCIPLGMNVDDRMLHTRWAAPFGRGGRFPIARWYEATLTSLSVQADGPPEGRWLETDPRSNPRQRVWVWCHNITVVTREHVRLWGAWTDLKMLLVALTYAYDSHVQLSLHCRLCGLDHVTDDHAALLERVSNDADLSDDAEPATMFDEQCVVARFIHDNMPNTVPCACLADAALPHTMPHQTVCGPGRSA
jgi:hypothetical protein